MRPRRDAAALPHVLVVDDYPDAREVYAEYFGFRGYRVSCAASGEEAIEQARKHRPDVILMDLSMPGLNGWEATRLLKADERTRDIPVIAVSGHTSAGASEIAHAAGCDSFIGKPCLPQDVLAEIQRRLAGQAPGEA
jgi:CheY-like chemotaxis protein